MKTILFICNRYTANQDIIDKKFGRQINLLDNLNRNKYKSILFCADYKKHIKSVEHYNGIKIYSYPLKFNNVFEFINTLIKTIKNEKPDVLIGGSVPLWGTLGYLISMIFRIPFIYDIQDNYENNENFSSIFSTILSKVNNVLISNFSVVSDNIFQKFNNRKIVIVIHNGVNINKFKPLNVIKCRNKFNFKSNIKYIGYIGSIANNRGISELQNAFLELNKINSNTRLVLAGGINDAKIIINENIIYMGNLDPNIIPELINAIDLIVIPNPDNNFTRYCFPYKILEAMACNKNILVGNSGFLEQLKLNGKFYINNIFDKVEFGRQMFERISDKSKIFFRNKSKLYSQNLISNKFELFLDSISKKRIAIICDNVDENSRTGTANYALNLINNLKNFDNTDYFAVHTKHINNLFNSNIKEILIPSFGKNIILGAIRKVILMPIILAYYKIDLVHETYQMGPFILPGFGFKKIVTVHDLFYKTNIFTHNILSTIRHTLSMPLILNRVDKIITVSNSSKNVIMKYFSVEKSKILVTYEGSDPSYKKVLNKKLLEKTKSKYDLPDKFLLSVCSIEPRKNILGSIKALQLAMKVDSNIKIVFVGKKVLPYFNQLELYIKKNSMAKNVLFLDYVNIVDLPAIYSLAYTFIFPSFYEGFGLPVLEAMKCGLPIITSNVSSLPEITGKSAIYVNPNDNFEIAKSIINVWNNAMLRNRLAKNVLIESKKFSWSKCVSETESVYKNIL